VLEALDLPKAGTLVDADGTAVEGGNAQREALRTHCGGRKMQAGGEKWPPEPTAGEVRAEPEADVGQTVD
jgi:hypothetical protein